MNTEKILSNIKSIEVLYDKIPSTHNYHWVLDCILDVITNKNNFAEIPKLLLSRDKEFHTNLIDCLDESIFQERSKYQQTDDDYYLDIFTNIKYHIENILFLFGK